MQQVTGVLRAGHQVASGIAPDSPYEKGTIEMQLPFFRDRGLDLSSYFFGTLNIDIAPHTFKLLQPQYSFKQVKWHLDYPAEDFSFSPCQVGYQGRVYNSLVYYPHPETKIGHFQDPSIIEIIAPPIKSIGYGNEIAIALNPREVAVV